MRCHAWIDNAVTVPSTVHELGSEVVKIRKRPGTKSTNAKRMRECRERDANSTLF